MVRLPEEFIGTKFDGYFFNTKNETLYSIKVQGVLRPMKLRYPCIYSNITTPAFYISVNGVSKAYMLKDLKELANQERKEYVVRVQ